MPLNVLLGLGLLQNDLLILHKVWRWESQVALIQVEFYPETVEHPTTGVHFGNVEMGNL